MEFKLTSEYKPTGDQPQAISQLVARLNRGARHNTLLGVTGSGKTFTMANVVAEVNRPTLVLCHNKTLAAQLYNEFKNFFPENAVEYYVSYYDYYQPEAYLPTTGTYIEKDLSINDEIEKMRLSTTTTLLSGRRDVIVVSSVSCIYGIGNPADFKATSIELNVGESYSLKIFLYKLVEALYTRTERELSTGTFRVNGDSVDIMSAYGDNCYRITMFDEDIEAIEMIDPATGARLSSLDSVTIFPANLFVTTKERIAHAIGQIYVDMGTQVAAFEACGREIEAQRLKQRVEYDLEMIKELGYCSGIENYSRYFDNRKPGVAPFCLLNYFPEDFITIIDESHVTLPQIRGMYGGDRARKVNLVEYGFRVEAAKDNRPLAFEEYEALATTSIYVSATPGDYELQHTNYEVVEQLIRPTGLTDPPMLIRPMMTQILFMGAWFVLLGFAFLKLPVFVNLFETTEQHLTAYFVFFIVSALFNGFNVRHEGFEIFRGLNENTGFMKVFVGIIAIQALIVNASLVPFPVFHWIGEMFSCVPFGLQGWIVTFLLAATAIPVDLLRKTVMHSARQG